MPIRPATAADIPSIAKVVAAAFAPDSLFRAIFPFQHKYPEDFERALRENLWVSWYDARKVMYVSIEAGIGNGETQFHPEGREDERQALLPSSIGVAGTVKAGSEAITGLAEWERVGGAGAFRVNGLLGWWDPRRLMKPLLSAFYRVRRLFIPNRATIVPTADNPQPLTYWMLGKSLGPFMARFMSGPHRKTHWSLEILGVDPRFQGHGYGRELVEHGLAMAKSDPVGGGDVPACVMAADGKEKFYQKCGFRELVGYVCEAVDEKGWDNPLRANGVGGGAVLWTR